MKRVAIRLAFLIIVAVGFLMYFSGGGGPTIESGSTLLIKLGGRYVEAPASSPLMRLLGEDATPFAALLSTFALAERDERLDAVVLRIRGLTIGWGKAGELRRAIQRLRAAGHKTVAVLDLQSFSANREYFIASAADEVYFTPASTLPLVGLAAEYLHYGGLWEQLGVEIEVARVGKYKSAAEVLAGKEMSAPTREMVDSLLDSTMEQFVSGIAEGRGLAVELVRSAIDAGPVLPEQLLKLKLIDGIQPLDTLTEMSGEVVKGEVYAGLDPASVGFEPVAKFALVYGSGPVVSGEGSNSRRGSPIFASDTVGQALLDAAADPQIDAIVFRIDSPGGSALASESVWRAIERAKSSGKPIIASFSDYAASGGYYAVAGADGIVSSPGTLTGSIGVFSLRPVVGGLLDKLGINVESLTRGRHADLLLSSDPLSDGARERMQSTVDALYELFVARVSEGRSMSTEAVDAVAQGRVWTGAQALEQGLVDELGGLRTAVLRAKGQLGLAADADVALVPYPTPRSLAQELQDLLQGRIAAELRSRALASVLGDIGLPSLLTPLGDWLSEVGFDAPVLIPPLLVEIR